MIEDFTQVLESNPKHVQSHGNLALAYAGLGRKAKALECLDKAISLDASYGPAISNRPSIAAMREGEPFIPKVFAETEYYAEKAKAEERAKAGSGGWWRRFTFWRRRIP